MIEKPKLFLTVREFWFSMSFLTLLLFVRLTFIYQEYETFKSKPFFFTDVEVIQAYEKWKDNDYYTILKLYSPILDINFFSRTKIRAEEIESRLRLKLYPSKKMKFREYLGSSFISSRVNRVYKEEKNLKKILITAIEKQHNSSMISNFYEAIFLAIPLDRELRIEVSSLGISHLIALSGFHLAILSMVLFFIIRIIYRPLQQKFFPYRFDLYDIGFIVLLILAWYVWFVDAPPSLLRSYIMMFIGWVLLVFGMELISFSFLFSTVLVIVIIFPHLLLSLAFCFSVLGVFYIFLLLHYFSHLNSYLITLLINFGIFFLMLPIVHLFFPIVSPLQLGSPFLSLLFTIFYPMSMVLHLVGFGNLFDTLLLKLFTLESSSDILSIEPLYGLLYLSLSFLAIYFKRYFYLLLLVSFLFFLALFMPFLV